MRVAHYLVRGSSGLFYVRLRIPKDLCDVLGAKIIKRATGTRCARAALACALVLQARYAQAFDAIRRGEHMAKPPSIKDIRANLREGRGSDYVIEQGPGGLRIEATDQADHDRAMQALEHIGRVGPWAVAVAPPTTHVAPSSLIKDMDEAIRMWVSTLPNATPGHRKNSKAQESKVRDFYTWKLGKTGGPFAVNSITRVECAEFFVHNKLTTTKRGAAPAPRTIENKFLALIEFLNWAQTSSFYPKGDNPATDHANVAKKDRNRRAKTHGWQAFSSAQLARIFDPVAYKSMRSEDARWLPLMALYTGARSNELAHLELEDCFDFLGQPVFDFNFLGPHKSLKTDASERKTPVHPDLLALGLWERVERLRKAGETKLFPGLTFTAENGPANAGQSAFTRHLERLGITARGAGIVGLHSFRDTVINTLTLAGVHEEVRKQYVGHESGSTDDHHTSYGIDLLPAGLAKHCHPPLNFGIDLDRLRALLQ